VLDGQIIICKIDAVYERDGKYEIVDWKTGKPPRDDQDLKSKQLQLALYRLAYSRWTNIPLERIDAVFYFVAENAVVAPDHLDDEQELIARWRAALRP
jgi:DNA helicase II / ATP-dependent DNA helicase PcrA